MAIHWTEFPERVEKFGDLLNILETFFRDLRVGMVHSGSCDKETAASAYTAEFMDGGEFSPRPERIPGWEQLATAAEREFHRPLSAELMRSIRAFVSEVRDISLTAVNELSVVEVAEIFDAARREPAPQAGTPDQLLAEFRWLKVTEIAGLFALTRSNVSKLATDGTFVTNGKVGNDRRIDVLSVVRWTLDRLKREGVEPE